MPLSRHVSPATTLAELVLSMLAALDFPSDPVSRWSSVLKGSLCSVWIRRSPQPRLNKPTATGSVGGGKIHRAVHSVFSRALLTAIHAHVPIALEGVLSLSIVLSTLTLPLVVYQLGSLAMSKFLQTFVCCSQQPYRCWIFDKHRSA